ncbi:hypothetical protein M407DRAFT_23843 [Tulasnella calospora MUT 4182]|uniref:Carbohydrate kinase FGGY N-terminal domain-containing protein n=1 Tax=Tulasnella calospora MUT 4182 TaxID=1051891 RepID=A0A0C3KZU3_9AGAM|nr:hypothetical protein M407DRAFT_23843 [Tulasnella calospora MUT 4182]
MSSAHFLGLELAPDQLRAAIIDTNLTVLGYEAVDFDSELQYGTRGGLFSTPGDAFTTPVDMWVKAMDVLFQKLSERFDLTKIKGIGGSAQSATVWLTSESTKMLASLSPKLPLAEQISPAFFSLIHTPVSQDTSTLQQTMVLEAALGGPDSMAARVGTASHPSLTAVQCMKIREGNPDAWGKTARVMMASTFLSTLLAGKWTPMTESEVVGTGMWNVMTARWDAGALEIVAGSPDQGRKFVDMLGSVEMFSGKAIGNVSSYFAERYGIEKGALIVPFTSDRLASYLSVAPSHNEPVLSFGTQDTLMVPATQYIPDKAYTLYPHPAQDPSEPRRYIAVISNRNAESARTMVRDMYTKSWSAFDRLISVIPPGGSIGLDDKLFSFWVLHNESPTSWNMQKGVYRVEVGQKVNEFRDLRANPRCLLESQLLALRVQYTRMMELPLFAKQTQTYSRRPPPISLMAYHAGTAFNPYDKDLCPQRLITLGTSANFPSIVAMIGDIFNSKVYVPTGTSNPNALSPSPAKVDQSPGGLNSATPLTPTPFSPSSASNPAPSRLNAALGSAYSARWSWRRSTKPEERFASFEDEIRSLTKRKWVENTRMLGGLGIPSLVSPVASMGYPQPKRSGLAASVYTPDEDDMGHNISPALTPPGAITPPALIGLGLGGPAGTNGLLSPDGYGVPPGQIRSRTPTQSSNSTVLTQLSIATSMGSLSTAQTSPGGTMTPKSPLQSAVVPSNVTVTALPSTTEEEYQSGLCKVAEPDWDAFMTYASIIPEFCRIEGMLVKGF